MFSVKYFSQNNNKNKNKSKNSKISKQLQDIGMQLRNIPKRRESFTLRSTEGNIIFTSW